MSALTMVLVFVGIVLLMLLPKLGRRAGPVGLGLGFRPGSEREPTPGGSGPSAKQDKNGS